MKKLRAGWVRADVRSWSVPRTLAYDHIATKRQVAWLGMRRGWCWRPHGAGWLQLQDGAGFPTIDTAMRAAEKGRVAPNYWDTASRTRQRRRKW